MLSDLDFRLGVCPVCDEVLETNGELPICENCLAHLNRWMPEEVEREPLRTASP